MTEKRSYRPNKSARPSKSTGPKPSFQARRPYVGNGATVYVGNLPYDVTEDDLNKLFSGFGRVRSVNIVKDDKKQSKGIGFLRMLKKADALKAIERMDGRVVGGRTIKCSEAIEGSGQPGNGIMKVKSKISRPRADKSAIASVKKERRKTGLQKMFESIKN